MRFATPFAALASVAALAVAQGCVTRTVYVVDDNPRNDRVATAAPAAEPPRAAPAEAPRYEDDAGIGAESDFYEPLSPYGRWVAYPGYGQVFVPSVTVVGAGFRPYTHGHWEYSEYGWTWVDHHPFGWATGHYGRWFYDGSYGWVWVPGTVWSPAWVTWRSGGGYVGWAAMGPGAEYGGAYTVYDTSWVFVSSGMIGVAYVGDALIVGPGYHTCYVSTYPERDTVVVYGRTYYRGPDEDDIARNGGHVVHRPARDADRERPVTRPPEGTVIRRHDDGRGTGSRPRADTSGTSRPRDDSSAGSSTGGHDGTGGRDSGGGGGRHSDGRDRTDPATDGRDDGRGPADTGGSVVRPSYPNTPSRDPRDPRDDRGSRHVPDLMPATADVTPREADPIPTVVNTQPVPVPERDAQPAYPYPRTGTADDVGTGVADDPRTPPTGVRDPRTTPVDRRPDLDGTRPDSRIPYDDTQRPVRRNPEDPDRVRDIAPTRPNVGGVPTNRTPTVTRPVATPPSIAQPAPTASAPTSAPDGQPQPANGKKKSDGKAKPKGKGKK